MSVRLIKLVALGALLLGACTPGPSTPTVREDGREASQPARTLTILTRSEPPSLAGTELHYSSGVNIVLANRIFVATLVLANGRDQIIPNLAEAVPQPNTETWKVLPDGRMETTYRLKPNLTWHDGYPLSAQDFVFAYKVYTDPNLKGLPYVGGRIDRVLAPDDRTVVVQWRSLWAGAGTTDAIKPLPRHILEQAHAELPPEAVLAHPYWSREYIGLGPYRLESWEPGAFIHGATFDGYALGRAKIERVLLRWSMDENVALANILAENVQLVTDRAIRFQDAVVLNNEWKINKRGVTVLTPTQNRLTVFQLKPEYANPASLLDLRVRQAVVSSIDRQAMNEGLFNGLAVTSPTTLLPTVPYYAEVERAITKYPYDPRRTEQLMTEAGYAKGSDGIFVNAGGDRFRMEIFNQAGAERGRETAIMADTWQRAGIDAFGRFAAIDDPGGFEARYKFPSLRNSSSNAGAEETLNMVTSAPPTPAQPWNLGNTGGYVNPEYDRLWAALDTALDPAGRARIAVAMEKLVSEDLPIMHLYFEPRAAAYLSILDGPDPTVVNEQRITWNIQDWKFR